MIPLTNMERTILGPNLVFPTAKQNRLCHKMGQMITLLGNLFQNSGNSIGYFHACFMKLHNTIAERKRNGKNMVMGSLGLVDRK